MKFRNWNDADVEEITALVVRCDLQTREWAPEGWALPEDHAEREVEIWREELSNDAWRAEVALDAHGSIVGVVGTDGSHVASLFVDPSAQNQGIGAALLARAEAWISETGHRRATLNVLEGSPAVRLYERCGWTLSGTHSHYEAFDLPTVGMVKQLPSGR